MKKLVSLVVAAALTLSTLSVFAANTFNGTELSDEVAVELDTKVAENNNYKDHDTEGTALTIKTSEDSATFNAQATISMKGVAEAWDEYLDAAENWGNLVTLLGSKEAARAAAVKYADLSESRFIIKISAPGEITQPAGKNVELNWSGKAGELFVQDGETVYNQSDDKTELIVTMMPKASNAVLDEYFKAVLDGTDEGILSLTINGFKADGKNVTYEMDSDFDGKIVIKTAGNEFGIAYTFELTFTDNTDVNYIELKNKTSYSDSTVTVPTEKPTVAPTDEPTEPTDEPTEPTDEPTEPTETPEPQTGGTQSGAVLNYDNHYAYIIGYDTDVEGVIEVRPENNITRAEVATIFYRLLDDASREKFMTTENDFSDVDADDWFNNAVSTVTAAGIFEGYEDGTFGPDKAITRAEFATIAARFSSVEYDGEAMFADIAGHWAADGINRAAATGWVNGYEDGTFRPENKITRAEAITLINRVLYRNVDTEGMLAEGYIDFADNATDAWYYIAIVEASNSHNFDREKIGEAETHIELTENIDWDAQE